MSITISVQCIDYEVKPISYVLVVQVGVENGLHKAIIAHHVPSHINSL
jgi:hypothetical protein